jgi:hypothetical protein
LPVLPLKSSLPARLALPTLLGSFALSLAGPAVSHAQTPLAAPDGNDITCTGNIAKGTPEMGVTGNEILYTFKCNSQITGYQIQSQLPVSNFDTTPNPPTQEAPNAGLTVATDSLSCNGSIPAFAFNCVGLVTDPFEIVTGQYAIDTPLCTEPREDPLLTVTYANLVKGVVTQYISGPFDLGRPTGCPKDAYSGDSRINGTTAPVIPPAGFKLVKVATKKTTTKKTAPKKATKGKTKSSK